MKCKELLKQIVKESGLPQAVIAEKMGLSSQGGVGNVLSREGASITSVVKLLNACGYRVMVVSDRKGEKDVEITVE